MPEPGQGAQPVVRVLTEPPNLLGSYLRAATRRRGGGDTVPDQVLRLRDVRPDVAHVAAYAEVCGDRLGSTLPPLYPHLLGFPLQMALLTDARSPFPAMGLVHVRNTVEATVPIPVGAPLDVEVEMQPPVPHRRGRTVDLVARVSTGGTEVWRSASTYLRVEPRRDGAGPGENQGQTEGQTEGQGEGRSGEEDAAPLDGPPAVWRLPADLGRRYAAVSGDRNPIHMSALSARLFGFPRAIAHGMWTAARALAALEGRLPDVYRADVRFRAPVLLPGSVEFRSHGAGDTTQVEVRARGKDKVHLVGEVRPL